MDCKTKKGKTMKKIICITALAAVAICLTGCRKEEPTAANQLKNKATEAANAADKTVRSMSEAAREAAKARDEDLGTELD